MSDNQALRVDKAQSNDNQAAPSPDAGKERSGVFAKSRGDAGGWGLLLVGLGAPSRTVLLSDGAVIGSGSRDAKLDGDGVAGEHARVMVRSDGCYLEDLGSQGGTWVGGVRARRIDVSHGDVVRLGKQVALFVERDLSSYAGSTDRVGDLVVGARQRSAWVEPVLTAAKSGVSVCIEGPPGVGKRTLAQHAAGQREGAPTVITIDGRAAQHDVPPTSPKPATWLVYDIDRLPRAVQTEIAHAIGRGGDVNVIATCSQPIDRAAADGKVTPWFASYFSGKRVAVPSLEARREDLAGIVAEVAKRKNIDLSRIGPEALEALLRSGWPQGVPQLEAALAAAAGEAQDGPLGSAHLAPHLSRATAAQPSLPPATDPSLARARIEDALARANGSVASAARSLGMSRQAIYREADRLGLDIARRRQAMR
jgi:pSer/pThr/pTyr-binding forkhead associated (FHA) protein